MIFVYLRAVIYLLATLIQVTYMLCPVCRLYKKNTKYMYTAHLNYRNKSRTVVFSCVFLMSKCSEPQTGYISWRLVTFPEDWFTFPEDWLHFLKTGLQTIYKDSNCEESHWLLPTKFSNILERMREICAYWKNSNTHVSFFLS